MRKSALALALLLSAAVPTSPQGKTTVDPNTAQTRVELRDGRLDQKVSYEAVNKRLHSVLTDLEKTTGVALRCGKNTRDWQVRDIPVTLRCTDVPLGGLLRAIADCNHLVLTRDKPDPDKENEPPVYRLWRDRSREREITDYFEAKRNGDQSLARWAWDTTLALAQLPDSSIDNDPKAAGDPQKVRFLMLRELGKALSELPSGQTDQVLSGDRIKLYAQESGPIRSFAAHVAVLRQQEPEILAYYANGKREERPGSRPTETTWDAISDGHIRLTVSAEWDDNADVRLHVSIPGPNWEFSLREEATKVMEYIGNDAMPVRPPMEHVTRPVGKCDDKNLRILKTDADWDLPLLETKLTIESPPAGQEHTHGDVLSALSKTGGFSLICEDFESYKREHAVNVPTGTETTVGEALRGLEDKFTWLVNEKEGLIVGWCRVWPERHSNLMPEKLLSDLQAKLDGEGVYLDDVTPLARFSADAFYEWIHESPELTILSACVFDPPTEPWGFYDSLSPRCKALAWSESGLSLARFDAARVDEAFGIEELDIIPGLVMRIETGSAIQISGYTSLRTPELRDGTTVALHHLPRELVKQDICHISVDGKKLDGEDFWRGIDGPAQPLPMFSPARETELMIQLGLSARPDN